DTETGKNLFYNRRDKYKLSKIAYGFIAGQMKYVKEMCAILSPTVNSYKRLVSGFEAPCYITWGSMNRSSLIRVPKWLKKESARIELRCPDSSCNPYLAFAIMAKGGLEGIKNDLTPPNPIEENVYKMEESLINEKNIEVLPNSLWEAIEEMKSSKIVYETLGKSLFEKYIEIKTREWNEYKRQVTLWEIEKYMEMY
ncbi:MAG TPA: glutamine synthetase, partial [Thermoplasmatales archaeon]|nr:glutamine synthetase [Thermoplasmatales archaeon]